MPFNVIGKTNPDKMGLPRTTGKLDFAADRVFEGMLYTRTLGSPYPHAKITAIDLTAALALAGVKAITTYLDCPVMTQELFFVGQEVAAVAATDPHIASQALELIKVTYQTLPYVVDPDKSLTNSTLTGLLPNKNQVGDPLVASWGDVTAGFAAAAQVAEDTAGWTATYQHSTIEPRSCVAVWDSSLQDQLTCYTTSQDVFGQRAAIAGNLGLPLNNVTVISRGAGSAFGDKHASEWCTIAAVLAKKAGAPVLNHLSRKENYLSASQQYADKARVKMGAKADGTLTAIDATVWTDVGALPWPAAGDAASPIEVTYNTPNAKFSAITTTTNQPRRAYWRCVGEPGGLFLMDIVTEQLAEKLNINPLDFRLKNAKVLGDNDNLAGIPLSTMALKECLNQVATAIGWSTKWHAKKAKLLPDGRYHGIGISGFVCNKGNFGGDIDGVIITSTTDGKFLIQLGESSIQSQASTQAYVAAEVIGANADDVDIGEYGNTAVTQNCGYQGGSTRTVTTGRATVNAATDMKNQLFQYAAPMLNTTPDKLSASGGKIYLTSDPTKFVTHAAVLADYGTPPLIGKGYGFATPTKQIRTTAATAVEVAVDPNTGAVEVLNIVTSDDLGQANSLIGSEGQIEGGTLQSLGCELSWSWVVDQSNGVPLNPDYLNHKFPTTKDVPLPANVGSIIVQSHDTVGPLGAIGLGEPPNGPPAPAINNAIYNAVGVWVRSQPATPAKVLQALGKA
jgi:CO/xanthine dehydrogenase Mo-binding subunit